MAPPVMTVKQLDALLAKEFPQQFYPGSGLTIEEVADGSCQVSQAFRDEFLRPGGTISGATLMGFADFTMYVLVLSAIGPTPLAVTTNLNINFLRKPAQTTLIADARMLKLGKRLAVGEVALRSHGSDDLVAHITSTYSIPPR